MNNRYLFFIAVFLIGAYETVAQQTPLHTQYMQNQFLLNPAVAGADNQNDIRVGYRNQWVGLENAPITTYATGHFVLGRTDYQYKPVVPAYGRTRKRAIRQSNQINKYAKNPIHHGLGFLVMNDRFGVFQNNKFALTYALHMPITNELRLSIGVQGGLLSYAVNPASVSRQQLADPAFATNSSRIMPNASVGAWLYSSQFYLGLSADQLLMNNYRDAVVRNGDNRLQPHFYGTAGYRMNLSEEFDFVPSLMVRYASTAAPSLDINGKLVYNGKGFVGLSWRRTDAVAIIVGANIYKGLELSYSYDYTTSGLDIVSNGSHEIVLGYRFGKSGAPQLCPSFFW